MADRFNDLNYAKLRKHHQELGVPWTDHTFPPNHTSIGIKKAGELSGVEWRRAGDLSPDPGPRLVKDGVGRHDVVQGKLGNCWFVAAASVLAGVEKLWERVVPDAEDQDWDPAQPGKYSGVFRFQFWRFGRWMEVLVDDLIPTRDGVPVFTHSKDTGEYWGALLEKAYAKLHGSYEGLDGGNLSDALVDFTGGVAELLPLHTDNGQLKYKDDEARQELFQRIYQEVGDHALVCAAIRCSNGSREERTETGLVKGHAYGVTALRKVPIGSTGLSTLFKGREKIALVRLRNPWGEKEWNGAFSDRSREWNSISEKERDKLGLVTSDDGEFWMPWEDFVTQFTDLSINHLINTSLFSFSKTWKEFTKVGKWMKPCSAGGCLNHPDTFLRNPQFRFDVTAKGEEDEEEVILQLTQKDEGTIPIERQKLVIGLHLMSVEGNRRYRIHQQLTGSDVGSSDYIRSRHVFFRARLRSGRYVAVPTTFNPGEEGEFLIRLYGDEVNGLTEMRDDEPQDPACLWCSCVKPFQVVTRVTVKSGSGFPKKSLGRTDPYLLIKCEGEKVRSQVVGSTLNPTWNYSAVFYRKRPHKPIQIQVWDSNLVVDSFLGQCSVDAKESSDPDNPFGEDASRTERKLDLYDRGRRKEEKLPGTIRLSIETNRDLTAF